MKNRIGRALKVVCAMALLSVIAVGVLALSGGSASAAARPLCGFSTIWDCTMPNGTHRTVGGTVCDINKFQQQTGAHCVPSGL
jgi:hypothetical protein